jgi:hypothetical protein
MKSLEEKVDFTSVQSALPGSAFVKTFLAIKQIQYLKMMKHKLYSSNHSNVTTVQIGPSENIPHGFQTSHSFSQTCLKSEVGYFEGDYTH